MYKPKHFALEELVSKSFYEKNGQLCWNCLDERALKVLDRLREKYGRITVNNWKWGGARQYSGLRVSGDQYYSATSQHSYGRAFDCIFSDVDSETVRQDILKNPQEWPEITFLETDISWFHFDVRNAEPIKVWSPTRGFV